MAKQPEPSAAPAADGAPAKKKKPILIIAIVAVVLLAGGGAAAWFLLGGKHDKKDEHAEEEAGRLRSQVATLQQADAYNSECRRVLAAVLALPPDEREAAIDERRSTLGLVLDDVETAEFTEARMVRNCTETGITRIFLPSDLQLDSWC